MSLLSKTNLTVMCLLATTGIQAQPGSGIRIGDQTVLSPSVTANISYNDNLNLQRRALSRPEEEFSRSESDLYLEGVVSLNLIHRSEQSQYHMRTWYTERQYQDFSELNRDTYGASLSWLWTSPHDRTAVDGSISFQQAVDRLETIEEVNPQVEILEFESAVDRVKRDEFRMRLNLDQQILQSLRGSLSYVIRDTEYEDDRFNNSTDQIFTARLGFDLTPKTKPYLLAGMRLEDSEGLDGHGENPFVSAGVRYSVSDKINFDGNIGFERFIRTPLVRERDPSTGEIIRVPGEELDDEGLKYSLSLNYAATDKSFFRFGARSGFGSLSNNSTNAREETVLSAQFTHRTTDRLQQTVSLVFQQNDYEEVFTIDDEEIDEVNETYTVQYGMNYQTVRPWMSFFALLSYEDSASELPNQSYTETQVTAGITLTY